MSTIRVRFLHLVGPLIFAAALAGCDKDEPAAPTPTSLSLASLRTVSGRLFGPGGASICRTVASGDSMFAELLNPEFDGSNDLFLDFQSVGCPEDGFALAQEPADAHLRVELPLSQDLHRLPWRTLDEFRIPPGGVNHPVHILDGTPLSGRATLDGQPIEGVPLNLLYDFNPNYGVTFANSGSDGRWTEFFGRTPAFLEDNTRMLAVGCFPLLGATLPKGFPTSPFVFPSSRQAVNCRFETAPATRFSHTATRLVVTPMPGDIGGWFSGELIGQFGLGWGVQFPIPLGSSPVHEDPNGSPVSQMFNGGLIIGLPAQGGHPVRVLHGADAAGEFACGDPCRDLGPNGVVTFSPTGARGDRKQVTWRYSDASSSQAVGLKIEQHSVDGLRPHDYVLFRFRIRNVSPSALTLYAGFFGDLDVDVNPLDDRGATALGGRLMYQVSDSESTIHVGTLLLGDAPVTGNYFFGFQQDSLSMADQVRALRGQIRRTTAGPTDLRYIHGVGPITLSREEAQDVWLAVVAGENRQQLLDNAAAAETHVAQLLSSPISDASETSRMVVTAPGRATSRVPCKNCKPTFK
jgi:hypothetical protein